MTESKLKIEEVIQETETFSDDALFNITSFGTDMTFRELITMYEEGDLEKPEMQRNYVWTKNEASRFIDSVLLGLPVPSIFLAKTKEEKRLIVDGYQRIMTIFDYVKTGIFGGDSKPFGLSNSEIINEKWRGKMFAELAPDEQRKIRNSAIHAIVFEQKHPQDDTGMYQIFERINTSGRVLKPQEIRNCVYHGAFNHLLIELNKIPVWRKVLDLPVADSRMGDMELILRAIAFSELLTQPEKEQRQINLVKYLNLYMGRNANINRIQSEQLQTSFTDVLTFLDQAIGNHLFRNGKTKDGILSFSAKVNPSILDSVFAATVQARSKVLKLDGIVDLSEQYTELINNPDYQQAISVRTTTIANIKKRIEIASQTLFEVEYEWEI
ncbi:MAG: DUF262 domain-containing protein [Oscillospiraceae bacterium]